MTSTIAGVLSGHAVRDPGAPAIVSARLGTLSFGGLVRHVRQIGAELAAVGIGPSSRVGIALQRGPEAALLNVAISASATVVPINPNLPAAELRGYTITPSNFGMIVVKPSRASAPTPTVAMLTGGEAR